MIKELGLKPKRLNEYEDWALNEEFFIPPNLKGSEDA